jgi:hypothetical protein
MLTLVGEPTVCPDCKKKDQQLTKCQHCDQEVCGDCRSAHSYLLAEVKALLVALKKDLDSTRQSREGMADRQVFCQNSLDHLAAEAEKVVNAFEEAERILAERKEQALSFLKTIETTQRALLLGDEPTFINSLRDQLLHCGTTESLTQYKSSLIETERA